MTEISQGALSAMSGANEMERCIRFVVPLYTTEIAGPSGPKHAFSTLFCSFEISANLQTTNRTNNKTEQPSEYVPTGDHTGTMIATEF